MSAQDCWNLSWASTCWTKRLSATRVGSGPTSAPERVGQRVGGVRGEHQRAVPVGRGECRGARGHGGLADTTLAGEQEDAHGAGGRLLRPATRRAS